MKALFSIILTFALLATVVANEVTRNYTLYDSQQLHASDLHALIDTATIGQAFYNDQLTIPNLGSGMYFLVLDPATQLYRRLTAENVLYGNTNVFLYAVKVPTIPSWATFDFFDPTNVTAGVQGITVSNLFASGSSNIDFAYVPFSTTNSAGATVYTLPNWLAPLGGGQTNNQPELLLWGTNGQPQQIAFTNFESNLSGDLATNLGLPGTFRQLFAPWTVYGTNVNYTNIWAGQTNFPITNLFLANPGGTNWGTLTDTDAVPVFACAQGTNTTATLLSLYEYMTNKNALPPYTTARCQFSGYPVTLQISNVTVAASDEFQVMTNWGAPFSLNGTTISTGTGTNFFATNQIYAVSFITNSSTTAPLWSGITTNQIYYIIPSATNQVNGTWCRAFSNYTTAALFLQNGSLTNCIVMGSGSSGIDNVMLYLTNYASFNADVTPVVVPGVPPTVRAGVYDVWFRTPAANAFYYLTGSLMQNASVAPIGTYDNWNGGVGFSQDDLVTTNRLRIDTSTFNGANIGDFPLVHVLIQPQ